MNSDESRAYCASVPFGKNLRWIMPCHFRNRIHLATNEKGPHLGMEMVNLPTLDP
jgi:hypothetical protein